MDVQQLRDNGYIVKISHKRRAAAPDFEATMQTGEYPRNIVEAMRKSLPLMTRYQLQESGMVPLTKGGKTIVTLIRDGNVVGRGEATCRNDENFNKKLGRTIAIGRALQNETIKDATEGNNLPDKTSFGSYVPLGQCVDRGIYTLKAKNISLGVYNAETKGFIGVRTKQGLRLLETEYHFDTGSPHGTAKPLYQVGALPEYLELREGLTRGDEFVPYTALIEYLLDVAYSRGM